jgi:hypothetical protein
MASMSQGNDYRQVRYCEEVRGDVDEDVINNAVKLLPALMIPGSYGDVD